MAQSEYSVKKITTLEANTEAVDNDLLVVGNNGTATMKKLTFANLANSIRDKLKNLTFTGTDGFNTTSKTIPGAINELNSNLSGAEFTFQTVNNTTDNTAQTLAELLVAKMTANKRILISTGSWNNHSYGHISLCYRQYYSSSGDAIGGIILDHIGGIWTIHHTTANNATIVTDIGSLNNKMTSRTLIGDITPTAQTAYTLSESVSNFHYIEIIFRNGSYGNFVNRIIATDSLGIGHAETLSFTAYNSSSYNFYAECGFITDTSFRISTFRSTGWTIGKVFVVGILRTAS